MTPVGCLGQPKYLHFAIGQTDPREVIAPGDQAHGGQSWDSTLKTLSPCLTTAQPWLLSGCKELTEVGSKLPAHALQTLDKALLSAGLNVHSSFPNTPVSRALINDLCKLLVGWGDRSPKHRLRGMQRMERKHLEKC